MEILLYPSFQKLVSCHISSHFSLMVLLAPMWYCTPPSWSLFLWQLCNSSIRNKGNSKVSVFKLQIVWSCLCWTCFKCKFCTSFHWIHTVWLVCLYFQVLYNTKGKFLLGITSLGTVYSFTFWIKSVNGHVYTLAKWFFPSQNRDAWGVVADQSSHLQIPCGWILGIFIDLWTKLYHMLLYI